MDDILGKPSCGWVCVSLEGFEGHASYLTRVHFDILHSALGAIKYHIPFSLFCDEEGTMFSIHLGYNMSHILIDRDSGLEVIEIEGLYVDYIIRIVKDIEKNIDAWAEWDTMDDANYEQEKSLTLIELTNLIDEFWDEVSKNEWWSERAEEVGE